MLRLQCDARVAVGEGVRRFEEATILLYAHAYMDTFFAPRVLQHQRIAQTNKNLYHPLIADAKE